MRSINFQLHSLGQIESNFRLTNTEHLFRTVAAHSSRNVSIVSRQQLRCISNLEPRKRRILQAALEVGCCTKTYTMGQKRTRMVVHPRSQVMPTNVAQIDLSKSSPALLGPLAQASVSSKWKMVVDFSSHRIPVAERRAVIAACATLFLEVNQWSFVPKVACLQIQLVSGTTRKPLSTTWSSAKPFSNWCLQTCLQWCLQLVASPAGLWCLESPAGVGPLSQSIPLWWWNQKRGRSLAHDVAHEGFF